MLTRRICGLGWRVFRSTSTSAASVSSAVAVELPIWPEVKSLTARLAAASSADLESPFQELERLGFTRLNAEIERKTVDGVKRTVQEFPLNGDHAQAAIRTVLDSKTLDDPLGAAWRLAASLVDLHLTKLDDKWLLDLVRADLLRNWRKPEVTLEVYTKVCCLHPYLKIFPASIFELLSALRKANGKKQFYQEGLELVEKLGGRLPRHCIEGAILLAGGRSLEFFDLLKKNNRSVGIDELHYVCTVAAAVKQPKILEPLVQMHRMLPADRKVRLELYNTLAALYGKQADFKSLEVLWRALKEQIPLNEHPRYEHVFQRCRHFYRCKNKKVPEDLVKLLEKTVLFA